MSLIVVVSVLLVLVILAQNSKGGGLTSQFGGSGASNMIGVKKTTDLLEKITWGLAIALCVLAISSKFVADSDTSNNNGLISPSIERAQEQQSIPTLDLGTSEGINEEASTTGLEDLTTGEEGTDSLQ
ncbi:MAG: preprotein translocase subunit SecG [Cyclobacteriaceae bacterium]|nr:preprotein translocase subunit SecG [Cyclobacteriaceae bacterium]